MKNKSQTKFLKICVIFLAGLSFLVLLNNLATARKNKQIEEVSRQYPKIEINNSAKKLDYLLINLGLNPVSKNNSQSTPEKVDSWEKIREEVNSFLEKKLEQESLKNLTIPHQLIDFLTSNQSEINQIVDHLYSTKNPSWELDIVKIYQDEDPFNYSFVNYLGIVDLQKILMLQTLYLDKNNETAEINQVLEASFKLNQSTQKRPDLLAQMVSGFVFQYQMGILRQIDNLSPQWQEKLDFYHYDYIEGYFNAIELESILFRSPFLEFETANNMFSKLFFPVYSRMASQQIATNLDNMLVKLSTENVCTVDDNFLAAQVSPLSAWNPYGHNISAFYEQWLKSGKNMLDEELTKKVLTIKFSSSKDNISNQIKSEKSGICPQQKWQIKQNQKSINIIFNDSNFSQTAEINKKENFVLPLQFMIKNY